MSIRRFFAALGFALIVPAAYASDCNSNGVEDSLDLINLPTLDCNGNSYPDSCDLVAFPQFVRLSYGAGLDTPIIPAATMEYDGETGLDVIGITALGGQIAIYRNSGGYFYNRTIFSAGQFVGVALGDVNGDGLPEIIGWGADDVVHIYNSPILNSPPFPGELVQRQQFSGGDISKVAVADVNGDGFGDIVIGQATVPELRVGISAGGTIGTLSTVDLEKNANQHGVLDLAVKDLDGNGVDDVVALLSPAYVEAYVPGASFTFPSLAFNGVGNRIFIDDFDNDTDFDLFYVSSQEIVTARNAGFVFTNISAQPIGNPGKDVVLADFDGDAVNDFVLEGNLGILRGRTNGTFDVKPALGYATGYTTAVAGDFDADGRVDLFYGTEGPRFNRPGAWSQDADANSLPDECQPGLLTSPLYVPWNSFLSMVNILEMINPGNTETMITAELLDLNANELSEVSLRLDPGEQFDLIINGLPGFSANTYGTVRLTFTGGTLEGRMSNYRPKPGTSDFEFVTTLPLSQPIRGNSALTFNTFDPQGSGTSKEKERRRVDEWLSLINLSSTETVAFHVLRYDLVGNLLNAYPVFVRPFERRDIDGGHLFPGPNNVGANVILPDKPDVPYLAFSNRYGVTTDRNGNFKRYRYANTISAQAGLSTNLTIPFTRASDTSSIAEFLNPSPISTGGFIQIFRGSGELFTKFPVVIPANGQFHLQAVDVLPASENGSLQFVALGQNLLLPRARGRIMQSVNFVYDFREKELTAAYTNPARATFEGPITGSYNRYINLSDTLRVMSTTSQVADYRLDVYRGSSVVFTAPFTLLAHQTADIAIYEAVGALADTYGVLQITPTGTAKGIIGDVLRRRLNTGSANRIDFVASSPVR